MPRSVKAVHKRGKRTHRNRKAASKHARQKMIKKTRKFRDGNNMLAAIWDNKKSMADNMEEAGLILNPNKVIGHNQITGGTLVETMDLDYAKSISLKKKADGDEKMEVEKVLKPILRKQPKRFAKKLEEKAEADAKLQQKSRPPPALSTTDIQYCEMMVSRHGLNFEAMANDRDNIYQNTAKQMERKVKIFKKWQDHQAKKTGSKA